MEDTYVRLINCRLHLFRSSAYSFSSQYLLLSLKSSRICVILLPTPLTSVIRPSMASCRRQFLLRIWPIQLAFLRRIFFRSVLFSPIRSRTCSLVTLSLWPFYLLHSPPAPHFEALQILPFQFSLVDIIIYIFNIHFFKILMVRLKLNLPLHFRGDKYYGIWKYRFRGDMYFGNAMKPVHSPQNHFIITLITSDRRDWRDTRSKLARNPDRSWWHRRTNWKFFWPQPMAPWKTCYLI